MATTRTARRLDVPTDNRGLRLPTITGEEFGAWSESMARFFGTARYLAIQTCVVIVWIILNLLPMLHVIRWDPYPFILLNLAFSTQAAYAAPFILLAQNRQANRDRVQIESDRAQTVLQRESTDYISREIVAVRLNQGEVATRDYVRTEVARQLGELRELIREDLRSELTELASA
ncbi:MAG TPA: DUF1003 domain-containing protein [Mycobacteriales bacterium]|nr:DUF1003 domain-containing protein [Mycobacteriales bacterium]